MESSTDSDFDEEEEEDTDSVESGRLYENIVNRSKTTVDEGKGGGGPLYDGEGNGGGGPLYDEERIGGNGGGPLYENMEALTLENPSLRRRPRPTRRFDKNILILMIFTIQIRPTIKYKIFMYKLLQGGEKRVSAPGGSDAGEAGSVARCSGLFPIIKIDQKLFFTICLSGNHV